VFLELLNRQIRTEIPVDHVENEWVMLSGKEEDQVL